jgi:para-nitrobenzyl esterase
MRGIRDRRRRSLDRDLDGFGAIGPFTTAVPGSTLTGFMSMQVISQDHYTTEVAYGPGAFTYTMDNVGTRYVYIIIRTLADPEKTEDIKAANAVQDAIKFEQASVGKFEVPDPFDHLIGTAAGAAIRATPRIIKASIRRRMTERPCTD